MKCVLRGGPDDGKVTDIKPNVYAVGECIEIFDKDKKLLGRSPTYKYGTCGEREKNPCKKKGKTKVLRYEGPDIKDAIIPPMMSDRFALRPLKFEKMTPEEQSEVDKYLGILDWDGNGRPHSENNFRGV
ncbi:MAG: hypothetical protein HC888_02520 [Candidatus Competibacteraceae bacterium]|nr:hypothetical protein [Candidatus Competibacteraceae bacterium]